MILYNSENDSWLRYITEIAPPPNLWAWSAPDKMLACSQNRHKPLPTKTYTAAICVHVRGARADEVTVNKVTFCDKTVVGKMPLYRESVFRIFQNHSELTYFRRF